MHSEFTLLQNKFILFCISKCTWTN